MEDLLEIITDPELGGSAFHYGRIIETVDAKGRAVHEEIIMGARGNIQPAPGEERELLDDADRRKVSVLIFTPASLTVGEDERKADRIYHQGKVYRVALAEPWETPGFTKAVAVFERRF